jgi:hypothetical protein
MLAVVFTLLVLIKAVQFGNRLNQGYIANCHAYPAAIYFRNPVIIMLASHKAAGAGPRLVDDELEYIAADGTKHKLHGGFVSGLELLRHDSIAENCVKILEDEPSDILTVLSALTWVIINNGFPTPPMRPSLGADHLACGHGKCSPASLVLSFETAAHTCHSHAGTGTSAPTQSLKS